MKSQITKQSILLLAGILVVSSIFAQTGVLNPNDEVIEYDSTHKPVTPPSGTLVKWVKTSRVKWNTSSFKCYFYKGMPFRLKFPKSYQANVNDGKLYPLYIFFHGKGEQGAIYDNEYQLFHGAEVHSDAVDKGDFDGYLLYPQHHTDLWSTGDLDIINEMVNKYFIPEIKVDPYRVIVDGLSAGGSASWQFMIRFPKMVAACLPISAASNNFLPPVDSYKFTPIWHFQGALDDNPAAGTSEFLGNGILNAGGNYKYTKYPTKGHGCWNDAWAEPDYFPFMLRANKLNPWALFGRTEFCTGDVININIGITAGFTSYEWRKNGVVIAGANANTLNVTSLGTYDCRINNNGVWSIWSPTPLVVKIKAATVPPQIQTTGIVSRAIPAPDGSTTVPLEVPDGFYSYTWKKDPLNDTLSTNRFLSASAEGDYKIRVTEKYGCSSIYSDLFRVVNANGANGPAAPFNITATTVSKTAISLSWSQVSSPTFNETNFEIYQASSSNGPYSLINITNADASSYTVNNLNSGTNYYYILRAINNNAASATSNPVLGETQVDNSPPTAPGSLHTGVITKTSIELFWNNSSDDVGVVAYDIFINNIKLYVTDKPTFTIYNLIAGTSYTISVKARDYAGNVSAPGLINASTLTATSGNRNGSNTYSIKININDASNFAPNLSAPWNNTKTLPFAGYNLRNAINQFKDQTGVKLTMLQSFDGMNYEGMNTGNNSGAYPDLAMSSNWYVERYDTALLKIQNLNLTLYYSFTFFGSRKSTTDRITAYKIGNTIVTLNCADNIFNTAQINNVRPDSTGCIYISVYSTSGSPYGYLSVLEINSTTTPQASSAPSGLITNTNSLLIDTAVINQPVAYPNPFNNYVTLKMNLKNAVDKIIVAVSDASGHTIYNKYFENIAAGNWQPVINLNQNSLQPGLYFLRVVMHGEPTQTIKLLKVSTR